MKRSRVIFFIISFLIIGFLLFLNIKSANPYNPTFFNLKRLAEKTQIKLTSDPKGKKEIYSNLLDRRLSELVNVVMKSESKYVLTASLRYSTTAGQLTETIIEYDLSGDVNSTKIKLEDQQKLIRKLVEIYPRDDGEKKFVVDADNYLTSYIGMLSSRE